MHVEAISEPLLRLATDFAFETLTVTRGNKVRGEVVAEVLEDGSALGQDNGLGERRSSDGDHRRLPEWVDGFELRRCEPVGLSLVHFDGVLCVLGAFFKEPDHALRAGLLEPESG